MAVTLTLFLVNSISHVNHLVGDMEFEASARPEFTTISIEIQTLEKETLEQEELDAEELEKLILAELPKFQPLVRCFGCAWI